MHERRLQLFRQLERRDWQLWTLTLVVLISLGAFIGVVSLWKLQGTQGGVWDEWVRTILLLGFAALTMLFCAYVGFQQAAIKCLRRQVVAEDLRARALNREVTDLEKVVANVVHDRERERIKSEFISSVSHQLRTPLTNIRNSIDLIRQGKTGAMSEEQERFLGVAVQEVDRLACLVDQLLDLSKLESGRAQFKFKSVDLGRLVRQAVVRLAGSADSGKVDVGVELDPDLPGVRADPERIQQVVDTLLASALDRTPEGGRVRAWVRVVPEEDSELVSERSGFHLSAREDYVEVSIEYTGPKSEDGRLSDEDVRSLFDRFSAAPDASPDGRADPGLGLAVARDLVKAHEGALWAEARPRGTTFRLVLPTRGTSSQRLESVRRIGEAIEDARKRNTPFCLLVLRVLEVDVEAAGGDEVHLENALDALAALAQRAIRGSDSIVVHPALGEVHVLLAKTGGQGGRIVGDRTRSLLEAGRRTDQGLLPRCRIGIGYASFPDDAMTAVEIEELAREDAREVVAVGSGG